MPSRARHSGIVTLVNTPSVMDTKPWLPFVWAIGWLAPFIALLFARCEPKQ